MTDQSANSSFCIAARSDAVDAIARLMDRVSQMVPDRDDPIMDSAGTPRLDWISTHYLGRKADLQRLADEAGDAAEDANRHRLARDVRAIPEAVEEFMSAFLAEEEEASAWDALTVLWMRIEAAVDRIAAPSAAGVKIGAHIPGTARTEGGGDLVERGGSVPKPTPEAADNRDSKTVVANRARPTIDVLALAATISIQTVRRIMKKAQVVSSPRGRAGAKRKFTKSEVAQMVSADPKRGAVWLKWCD
ncbi:MAG: hypothetical protein ACKVZJ_12355 [Phycisphaerales bacterium]